MSDKPHGLHRFQEPPDDILCCHGRVMHCRECAVEYWREIQPKLDGVAEERRPQEPERLTALVDEIVSCADEADGGRVDARRLAWRLVELVREDRRPQEWQPIASAARTLLRGFGEGVFVRSTANDGDSAWAMKLFPFIQALAVLQQAFGENLAPAPPGAACSTTEDNP